MSQSQNQTIDRKPNVEKLIRLCFKNPEGRSKYFCIKGSDQLQNVMDKYCHSESVETKTFRFLFDGTRLLGGKTPDQFGLEDGDMIDVFGEQSQLRAGNLRKTENEIVLCFMNQKGERMYFWIKKNDQLQKLMDDYCRSQSVAMNTLRFFFDDRRIQRHQTPNEVSRYNLTFAIPSHYLAC
ncbi:Ubiquitin-like modifier [Thalictrum thalictroides]|uniref:Ubiquitin-like modifier n=1 Tax=Thalictrum thalictroides TaxID=46969 RepID=A0A7J6VA01_THATH|nr:Ubiquitin-like modifier [Thalictrum thalictroides]